MISIENFTKSLELETLVETKKTEMPITSADFNRPGMQLCNFYDYFPYTRPQIIGKVEMTFLETLTPAKRSEILTRYMSYDIPCIILSWGLTPPIELVTIAKNRNIPIFRSTLKTTKLSVQLILYLTRELAPHITRHGVLVEVFGVGVFITGESGVGKSESALELVKRGHQLCADDAVDIKRVSDDRLIGESPAMVRHFMEIRGIGIIDIRAMYGVGAVVLSKSIDMCIHLERWDSKKEYERFGLEENYIDIMGIDVPYQVIPVKPGRNLAIIIEVAARNLSLKRMGYSAARELDRRLNELIANAEKNKLKEEN